MLFPDNSFIGRLKIGMSPKSLACMRCFIGKQTVTQTFQNGTLQVLLTSYVNSLLEHFYFLGSILYAKNKQTYDQTQVSHALILYLLHNTIIANVVMLIWNNATTGPLLLHFISYRKECLMKLRLSIRTFQTGTFQLAFIL